MSVRTRRFSILIRRRRESGRGLLSRSRAALFPIVIAGLIAGVMGGLNSEIQSETTRVLIESACFDPLSVRKTSKKLGLGTDASRRFERGVDPAGTLLAANRAAQLMA